MLELRVRLHDTRGSRTVVVGHILPYVGVHSESALIMNHADRPTRSSDRSSWQGTRHDSWALRSTLENSLIQLYDLYEQGKLGMHLCRDAVTMAVRVTARWRCPRGPGDT